MAQVHAINSDKAIKAIKQAIACHGFCGSEVPWKICRGQGLLLKAKAKDLTFKAKANDSKFVLDDTSRPRTTTLAISQPSCMVTAHKRATDSMTQYSDTLEIR